MCGIAAVLLTPQQRPPDLRQAVWHNFTENLLFNEKRGQEATGVALLQADGTVQIVKEALPAHQFVQTPAYRALRHRLNERTTLLLGHTRHPTQGSPAVNGNNHPIQVGTVFGVHNGRIKNEQILFAREGFSRQAQVDSEIIFQLLHVHSPTQSSQTYLHNIRPQVSHLRGEFTFLAGDTRAPGRLLVVKHRKPMSVHYHHEWQALIFSSRYVFLRKQFGRAVVTEAILPDQLLLFDAHKIPARSSHPAATLPLYSTVSPLYRAVEGGQSV